MKRLQREMLGAIGLGTERESCYLRYRNLKKLSYRQSIQRKPEIRFHATLADKTFSLLGRD